MRDIFLTGTAIVEPARRIVKAGGLQAEYDQGGLRWIKWNGVEILRAIMFLVRTPGWGTPAAEISKLSIDETPDRFSISYEAHYGEKNRGVIVNISLNGHADGSLIATSEIRAEAPFMTNRSGFVILHPLDGFAGTQVEIDHASGPSRSLVIPAQISPGQPVMDMKAITHRPVSGLTVETRFEGDIFEMEDHRNWSDASFKTYSRPIGLPYPYELTPNEPIQQSVAITITDSGVSTKPAAAIAEPAIAGTTMPAFVLPLDRLADAKPAVEQIGAIQALAPNGILLRFDLTTETPDADFTFLAELLSQTNASLELQIILKGTDGLSAEREVAAVKRSFDHAKIAVDAVSAFAKVDEQSFQPGQERPPHPSEEEISALLNLHFPEANLIGGTPAFFTEFNRKRPDPALWQGMTFATTPVVHAADDVSVMETLGSLPHILNSARQLSQGLPISIGPTGIGARLNPYGDGMSDNHPDDREGMAAQDPRQRGLFAAAWIVGYLTRIVAFQPARFAFGAPVGPFGLISTPQAYDRVFWDDQSDGIAYPLYHVARWIGSAASGVLLHSSTDDNVAKLIWEKEGSRFALVANLSPNPQPMPTIELLNARTTMLDASTVELLSKDLKPEPSILLSDTLELDSYAVLFVREEG